MKKKKSSFRYRSLTSYIKTKIFMALYKLLQLRYIPKKENSNLVAIIIEYKEAINNNNRKKSSTTSYKRNNKDILTHFFCIFIL